MQTRWPNCWGAFISPEAPAPAYGGTPPALGPAPTYYKSCNWQNNDHVSQGRLFHPGPDYAAAPDPVRITTMSPKGLPKTKETPAPTTPLHPTLPDYAAAPDPVRITTMSPRASLNAGPDYAAAPDPVRITTMSPKALPSQPRLRRCTRPCQDNDHVSKGHFQTPALTALLYSGLFVRGASMLLAAIDRQLPDR
ncbi:hypothetical protein VM1G_12043 [Cytospora mali]|uniref:Uncharacterized protein n=1 Tax=Cytospora mali TaxID=578113 RepID=A0A194VJ17_CYTMA|nr:hypothetical protein VM1G_12043 [Valsa mali]